MKTNLWIAVFLAGASLGAPGTAAEAKKSKISKTAPRLEKKEEDRDISSGKAPLGAIQWCCQTYFCFAFEGV